MQAPGPNKWSQVMKSYRAAPALRWFVHVRSVTMKYDNHRGSASDLSSSGKHHVAYFWLKSFMLAPDRLLVSVGTCCETNSLLLILPVGWSRWKLAASFLRCSGNPTPTILIYDCRWQHQTTVTLAQCTRSCWYNFVELTLWDVTCVCQPNKNISSTFCDYGG